MECYQLLHTQYLYIYQCPGEDKTNTAIGAVRAVSLNTY